MNTRFQIGRVAGIALDVHWTFALLLAWIGLDALLSTGNLAVVAAELAFVVLLFGAVLLHELGHAFMARQFGVGTRAITLMPIGGVAQMDGMPARPAHEMLVALAGPAVNMALATVLLPLTLAFSGPEALLTGHGLFAHLLWANVGLALFNLLPAFPMDGGRVLRSALTMMYGPQAATATAASVGQGVAVAMGVVGLFTSPMLVLIAVFVWMQAEREAQLPRVIRVQRIERYDPWR